MWRSSEQALKICAVARTSRGTPCPIIVGARFGHSFELERSGATGGPCERVNLTVLLSWATYNEAYVHGNIWHGEKKKRRKQALDPATEIYIISVRGTLLNTVPLWRFPIRHPVGLQPYDGNGFTFDLVRSRDGGGSVTAPTEGLDPCWAIASFFVTPQASTGAKQRLFIMPWSALLMAVSNLAIASSFVPEREY